MADIYFHTWLSRDKTLTFDTQVTYANQTCIRLVTCIRYTVKIDKSDMYTV